MIDDRFTEQARDLMLRHLLAHEDPSVRVLAAFAEFPADDPAIVTIATALRERELSRSISGDDNRLSFDQQATKLSSMHDLRTLP